MELFDLYINKTQEAVRNYSGRHFAYNRVNSADTISQSELVLMRDTAFELGGNDLPCVGFSAVTKDIPLKNETVVIGKDLTELNADSPFVKAVLVNIDCQDEEDQKLYEVVKQVEYIKYKVFIKGFMSRASAVNHREQIRVSKQAVKDKLTFEKVGNALITEYLKLPFIKNVTIVFCTDMNVDFDEFNTCAFKIKEITKALNHIFDNLMLDCKNCNLKQICDEVEGMKEMHLRSIK